MSFDIPQIPQQHLFLLFLLYSFVGWVCEEIWVSTLYCKIEKRGMLAGPVCPIYGFGALIILFAIYPWRGTWVRLFIASAVCASVLEYFSSWLLETLFHTKWWDYSKQHFNLNGRVCLLNSCAFGVGGVCLDHFLHPVALKIVFWQPVQPYIGAIYFVLSLVFASDVLFTIRRLVTFSEAMERLKMFSEQIRERYEGEAWFKADDLHTTLAELKARLDEGKIQASQRMKERVEHFTGSIRGTEVFFRKFPTMTSRDWKPQMEHARLAFKESVEKKIAQKKQQKQQRKGNR